MKIIIEKHKDYLHFDALIGSEQVGYFRLGADADGGHNLFEVFKEFRGQGIGRILLLSAIKAAKDYDLDFWSDSDSITPAANRIYDALEEEGAIVGDGNWWEVTESGEETLEEELSAW